jgi:hypothetical protein
MGEPRNSLKATIAVPPHAPIADRTKNGISRMLPADGTIAARVAHWEFGISRRQLKLDYTRGAPARRRLLPACSRKQYFASILLAVRKIPGADAQHRH